MKMIPQDVDLEELRALLAATGQNCQLFPSTDAQGQVEGVDAVKLQRALKHSTIVVAIYMRGEIPGGDYMPGRGGDASGQQLASGTRQGERWMDLLQRRERQKRRLVAFGRASSDTTLTASIHDVAVAPTLQRCGLGRRVIQRILRARMHSRAPWLVACSALSARKISDAGVRGLQPEHGPVPSEREMREVDTVWGGEEVRVKACAELREKLANSGMKMEGWWWRPRCSGVASGGASSSASCDQRCRELTRRGICDIAALSSPRLKPFFTKCGFRYDLLKSTTMTYTRTPAMPLGTPPMLGTEPPPESITFGRHTLFIPPPLRVPHEPNKPLGKHKAGYPKQAPGEALEESVTDMSMSAIVATNDVLAKFLENEL
eukprot:jgi/Mesen1/5103/ME000253S04219